MASAGVPDLSIGWRVEDPGPPPVSPLFDVPPVPGPGDDPVALHHAWRWQAEQDQLTYDHQHAQVVSWYPIPKPDQHHVVPVVGGTALGWAHVIAGLVMAGSAGRQPKFSRILVANLSSRDVFGVLEAHAAGFQKTQVRFDQVSAQGSSVDLTAASTPDDLVSLVTSVARADPSRAGSLAATRGEQELRRVTALLSSQITLHLLGDALHLLVLGTSPPGSALSAAELRALQDHRANVTNLRDTMAQLAELLNDVRYLEMFGRDPSLTPRRVGAKNSASPVRCFQIGHGTSAHDWQRGRDLLISAMSRLFARPGGREMLIVAGADSLPEEVVDHLSTSAQRLGKQLVLLFEGYGPVTESMVGAGGSGFVVFLRLPRHSDATAAADQMGKQFTFVVNGVTISESDTQSWNRSQGTSTSHGRTTSRSSGSGSGMTGAALSFGSTFGSSVSNSITTSVNQNQGVGGAHQHGQAIAHGRVHEHIVQPVELQQLDELTMLAIVDDRIVLGSVDTALRGLPITARHPIPIP